MCPGGSTKQTIGDAVEGMAKGSLLGGLGSWTHATANIKGLLLAREDCSRQ